MKQGNSIFVFGAIATALTLASPARACLTCDGETGQQVRAELVDERLPVSVAATVLPFVVVAGVVAFVHFGPPWRRS